MHATAWFILAACVPKTAGQEVDGNATASRTSVPEDHHIQQARMAANVAGVVGAVGCILTASPGMVFGAGRLMLLANLKCNAYADLDPTPDSERPSTLQWMLHPLGAGVGAASNPHRWYLGAVLSNLLLYGGSYALAKALMRAKVLQHIGAWVFLPALCLLPGTAYAAARLVFSPRASTIEACVGAGGLIIVASVPVVLWQKVVSWRRFRAATIADPRAAEWPFYKKVFGASVWVALKKAEPERSFVSEHRSCFEPYRYGQQRFIMLELVTLILLSIATAWDPGEQETAACWARDIGVGAFLCCYIAFFAVVQPYMAPLNNTAEIIVAVLGLCFAALRKVKETQDEPTGITLLVAGTAITIKVLWDIGVYFVAGKRRIRYAQERYSAEQSGVPDPQDLLSSVEELEDAELDDPQDATRGSADPQGTALRARPRNETDSSLLTTLLGAQMERDGAAASDLNLGQSYAEAMDKEKEREKEKRQTLTSPSPCGEDGALLPQSGPDSPPPLPLVRGESTVSDQLDRSMRSQRSLSAPRRKCAPRSVMDTPTRDKADAAEDTRTSGASPTPPRSAASLTPLQAAQNSPMNWSVLRGSQKPADALRLTAGFPHSAFGEGGVDASGGEVSRTTSTESIKRVDSFTTGGELLRSSTAGNASARSMKRRPGRSTFAHGHGVPALTLAPLASGPRAKARTILRPREGSPSSPPPPPALLQGGRQESSTTLPLFAARPAAMGSFFAPPSGGGGAGGGGGGAAGVAPPRRTPSPPPLQPAGGGLQNSLQVQVPALPHAAATDL